MRAVADLLLAAVQSVHVKNRCAFLNHSGNASVFMELVEQHPNIRLWFSVSLSFHQALLSHTPAAWSPIDSTVAQK
jgi:hypothetical protein